MKKLSFLLVFAIFCIIGTVAQEFTYGDFEFTINNDNETVTLLGHVDGYAATGQITIPSLAYYNGNGYIVTIIDSQAFYYSEGLTGTLLIPGSIRRIGDLAFYKCTGINDVVILATNPPTLGNSVFDDFGGTLLTVPCGCIGVYKDSPWYEYFHDILQDCATVTENGENGISIYPNPVKGVVKIEAVGIQNIRIYNTIGELVFEGQAEGDTFEYDFTKHGSGVYFVRVEAKNGVTTSKVTVR